MSIIKNIHIYVQYWDSMENHSCNTPNRAWWDSFSGSGRVHHSLAKPKTGPGNLEHWCGVAKLGFFLLSLTKIPKTKTTSSVAYVNFGTGHKCRGHMCHGLFCVCTIPELKNHRLWHRAAQLCFLVYVTPTSSITYKLSTNLAKDWNAPPCKRRCCCLYIPLKKWFPYYIRIE